jgi:outer membrane protein TolC
VSVTLTAITQAQLSGQISASEGLIAVQQEQLALTRRRMELGVGTELEVLALREVADVLRTVEHDAQVQQSLTLADTSARQSLQLVQKQHALGAVSYLQLLQAQQQVQQTRIAVLELQAPRIVDTVALYQAMGASQLQ